MLYILLIAPFIRKLNNPRFNQFWFSFITRFFYPELLSYWKSHLLLDTLVTGINIAKLEKQGIRTIDIYDPRDVKHWSEAVILHLLEKISLHLPLRKPLFDQIAARLKKINYDPLSTTITRGVSDQEVAQTLEDVVPDANRLLFATEETAAEKRRFYQYHFPPISLIRAACQRR